ncbi:Uncharacterised protein [Metamycoplasma cloacale]|uniref:Uncharacterized protein n=1 Tax=Metamycoplasma cloacale TaxID=92401 RepID=A0A2Z4LLX6_9BACT|nr:hypothetical protein [Metamycoplasma cloacale]AWX42729.1 hypothetical protein DK849_01390 [Metamycoplasma cloacale]VEU79459.1 Uncharacterised protein [Metamycoplasma cloacale]
MAQQEKSILEKYYISEKVDHETNTITFSFKKAKQARSLSYDEFLDALSEYIRVSEISSNDTRVWFHREGAYRGSVNLEKAKVIMERLTQNTVKKEEVITYLEKEDLVDKPAPKKSAKVEEEIKECSTKEESSCCESSCEVKEDSCCCELNSLASLVKFHIEDIQNRDAYNIGAKDIKAELEGYDVEIIKVNENNKGLDVHYIIKKGEMESLPSMKTLHGFKSEFGSKSVVKENISKGFWALVVILILLIITNVVLIALRATSVI